MCSSSLLSVWYVELEVVHPRRPRGSQSGREKGRDECFQVRVKEPLDSDSHWAISKNSSGCRLLIGLKKCFVLWCPIGEQFLLSSFGEFVHDGCCLDRGLSGSCTKEMHAVRKLSVWYKIPIWFQNTVCPKTKDTFPKIQAWAYNSYSHFHLSRLCVNIREFLKDTTRTENHEIVAWKREFTFFQFLSWLFQLAYFAKCKRTLLELNIYQPYPSSIMKRMNLSLLVYVLLKTWLIRHFHG